MSVHVKPRHRGVEKTLTPFVDMGSALGAFGKSSVAVVSVTGIALTAAVASTATATAPTSLPTAPSSDFTSNLELTDSATLVSLDVAWEPGDSVSAKAEEPAPEPVVLQAASRSSERAIDAGSSTAPPARLGSVVDTAMQYLGYPYVWGTAGPSSFDCSGFTSYIYGQFGISLSRSSDAQMYVGTAVSLADAQPGDLFVKPGHVGIYMGGGQIIHASSPSTGVIISPLSWYNGQSYGFRRL